MIISSNCMVAAMILCCSVPAFAQQTSNLLESGRARKLSNPPAIPTTIKIVSYNIRWRSGKDLQAISDWLKTSDNLPPIIGLQEVDRAKKRSGARNHARALAESLGMYYAWGAPPPPEKRTSQEEETGVTLISPYPLADVTRIVLPHAGPGGRFRVALGATLKVGTTQMRVYSVHSETRIPVPKKLDQLRAVIEDLARFPKTMRAVILGDFNSWEPRAVADVRELFTGAGFATPFADHENTFCRSAVLFNLELKLDWIWLRGWQATSHGIDRRLKVSDHYPLWAIVNLAE